MTPERDPAGILTDLLHDRTQGILSAECLQIAAAQLTALADDGYVVVARDDLRVAWTLAAKAVDELPAGRLPDPAHLEDVADALTRVYALLAYACPARRHADDREAK